MTEESIFAHALEIIDPVERLRYLDQACAEDPELRQRVQMLLQAHVEAGHFLNPHVLGAETVDSGMDSGTKRQPTVGGKIRYVGDYELEEELAHGGMGIVFRARQMSLNRRVALKMILKGDLAGEFDVRRFHIEAEAAASLDHPNIVPIYEVGEHEGQHFFSMKLVEGGNLQAAQSNHAEVNRERFRWIADVLAPVADAIQHAHERGILHRDLKPANILIDASGTPLVTDFGLAKRINGDSGQTQSGAILGTPSYMAPEQARGEKALTPAVDIYSLGAVLYEMLAHRPPFRADTPLRTLVDVMETEPIPPRILDRRIPRDLETICLKCLEKDPARRYGSAADFADDLRRFRNDEPIHARPPGVIEKARRFARRWHRPFAGLAAVLLAAVGAWYFSRPAIPDLSDLEPIQGLWKAIRIEEQGFPRPTALVEKTSIQISGDQITIFQGLEWLDGRCKVDAKQTPMHLDIIATVQGNEITRQGIFEMDGGTLRLCLAAPGEPRPISIADHHQSRSPLITFARERPETDAFLDSGYIPKETGIFMTADWATFWSNPTMQPIKIDLERFWSLLQKELVAKYGKPIPLQLEQIERLSLAINEPDDRSVFCLRMKNTFDKTSFVKEIPFPNDVKTEEGKTLWKMELADLRLGLLFLNDRTLLIGPIPDLMTSRNKQSPISESLGMALDLAKQPHHLVVGFQVPKRWANVGYITPDLPEEKRAREIFDLVDDFTKKRGTVALAADFGHPTRLQLRWQFASEDQAKRGAKFAPELMPKWLPNLRGIASTPRAYQLLNQFLGVWKAPSVTRWQKSVDCFATWDTSAVDWSRLYQERIPPEFTSPDTPDYLKWTQALESQMQLIRINEALHAYHKKHGHFPPPAICDKDGRPLLSWRVALLPFVDNTISTHGPDGLPQFGLDAFRLDEPWDSAHNKKFLEQIPPIYQSFRFFGAGDHPSTATHYQVFVGKGAAFEAGKSFRLDEDFPDGAGRTLFVVEAGTAVPWAKPEDMPFEPGKPLAQLGLFGNVFHGCLVNGSVQPFSKRLAQETLRALITRNGGELLPANLFEP